MYNYFPFSVVNVVSLFLLQMIIDHLGTIRQLTSLRKINVIKTVHFMSRIPYRPD